MILRMLWRSVVRCGKTAVAWPGRIGTERDEDGLAVYWCGPIEAIKDAWYASRVDERCPVRCARLNELRFGDLPRSLGERIVAGSLRKAHRRRVDVLARARSEREIAVLLVRRQERVASLLRHHEQRSCDSLVFIVEAERRLVREAEDALALRKELREAIR
jgi:hypothetical protein